MVLNNGSIYVTNPGWDGKSPARSGTRQPQGRQDRRRQRTEILERPDDLARPEPALPVADSRSHWVYSYQIQADGLAQGQASTITCTSHDRDDDSGADGCGSTKTAASTWRPEWDCRSATRRDRSTASSPRRTEKFPISRSADRRWTRSMPPAETRCSSGRSRSWGLPPGSRHSRPAAPRL